MVTPQSEPVYFGGSCEVRGGVNGYAYADGDPINLIVPLGLASCWLFDCPSVPQGVVDFSSGFGDTISWGATDGIRSLMGTNGEVNKCSGACGGGVGAGVARGLAWGGATASRYSANVGASTFLSDARQYGTVQGIW